MEELNLPHPKTHMVFGPRSSLLTPKRTWDKVRTSMRECKIEESTWTGINKCKIPGIYKYTLSPNFFLFTVSSVQTHWYVLDYDQVMMINDTVNSRVQSIIYTRLLPASTLGIPDEDLLIRMLRYHR
jgi:hypothetical protein